MKNINEIANKYKDELIKTRRFLHQMPEESRKEFKTSTFVKEELKKHGIPFKDCGLETGILATVEGKKKGKTVLLRGDMDGLSVEEETGLEFKSKNKGFMHACGHDSHTSMLLFAAFILNELKDEMEGTVKLAFQPAEEVAEGAQAMIKDGALEGVDACFGMHIWSQIPSGKIVCMDGSVMASCSQFEINVQGKGGHGSEPENTVDALVCACSMVGDLQTLISREYSPLRSVVCTVGKIEAGSRFNIIADKAKMEGTGRCFDLDVYDGMASKMDRIIQGVASAYRCKATLDFKNITKPVINNPKMAGIVRTASVKATGREDSLFSFPPMTGSEDFSAFIEACPGKMGALAFLGCGNEKKGTCQPHHSPKFLIDEDVLLSGCLLYVNVALESFKQL